MKVGDFLDKIESLKKDGKITDDTELFVVGAHDEDYDRTTEFVFSAIRKTANLTREIILVDENDDIWNRRII